MERRGVEQMDKVVGKITNHPCPAETGDKELYFYLFIFFPRRVETGSECQIRKWHHVNQRERGGYTYGATHGELKIEKH